MLNEPTDIHFNVVTDKWNGTESPNYDLWPVLYSPQARNFKKKEFLTGCKTKIDYGTETYGADKPKMFNNWPFRKKSWLTSCKQVLWLGGNTADPRNWTGVGLFYLELVNVGHEDLSACHFRKQLIL